MWSGQAAGLGLTARVKGGYSLLQWGVLVNDQNVDVGFDYLERVLGRPISKQMRGQQQVFPRNDKRKDGISMKRLFLR